MTAASQTIEQRLTDVQIHDLLATVSSWILNGNTIEREFMLKDFRGAVDFVCRIADLAEKANHHPDICIYYNKVHIKLSTHKAGGLTRKDFDLAARIERVS